MEIYIIGFYQKKTAKRYCSLLKDLGVFFTGDLRTVNYVHEQLLAPRQGMLDGFKKKKGDWPGVRRKIFGMMAERNIEEKIDPSCFCSSHCASDIESMCALAGNSRQTQDL